MITFENHNIGDIGNGSDRSIPGTIEILMKMEQDVLRHIVSVDGFWYSSGNARFYHFMRLLERNVKKEEFAGYCSPNLPGTRKPRSQPSAFASPLKDTKY